MTRDRSSRLVARLSLALLTVALVAVVFTSAGPLGPVPVAAQTATTSPTPTPTPTATEEPPAPRAITLVASDSRVTAGATVVLRGDLVSTDPACEMQEFVVVKRRNFGRVRFHDYRSTLTDSDGSFRVHAQMFRSAEFRAVATRTEDCGRAVSADVTVRVRVRVTIEASENPIDQGQFFALSGKVTPKHPDTRIVLLRKKSDRFVKIDETTTDSRSRYSFTLAAGWEGERTFRTRWPKQHRDHEGNLSRALTIRTR